MANQKLPTLKYTGKSESAVPIVSESELQTVTAEPWVKISDKGLQLEGLNFNRCRIIFNRLKFCCNLFCCGINFKNIPFKHV